MSRNFPGACMGVDMAFASDLPPAAGLSTSSAFVIAVFLVLAEVNGLARRDEYRRVITGPERLAEYVAAVENGQGYGPLAGDAGVGTFGGSEDHAAILCGVAGTVSQFAFAPTRLERRLPLPFGWVFVVGSSGVMAQKTGGARDRYNRAALAARQVLDLWRAGTGRDDVSLAAAVSSAPGARERLRALVESSDIESWPTSLLLDRYDQFCIESLETVPAAGAALATGDLASFGALVDRSQRAAERLLGNQVPETIALARSARELGAAAASAFGAGFGGSVWALVETGVAPGFLHRWRQAYLRAFPDAGAHGRFFVTRSGPAAFSLRGVAR
jgi:galactokinase